MKAMRKLALFMALVLVMAMVPTVTMANPNFTVTFGPGVTARTSPGAINVVNNTTVPATTWVEFTTPVPAGAVAEWSINGSVFGNRGVNPLMLQVNANTNVQARIVAGGHGHGVTFIDTVTNVNVPVNAAHTLQRSFMVSGWGATTNFTHVTWEWQRFGGTGLWDWNWANRTGRIERANLSATLWNPVTLHLSAHLSHADRGGQWHLVVHVYQGGTRLTTDQSPPINVSIGGAGGGGWWGDAGWWGDGTWWTQGGGGVGGWEIPQGGIGTTIIPGRDPNRGQDDRPPAGAPGGGPALNLPVWTGGEPTLAMPGIPSLRLVMGQIIYTHWGIPMTADAAPFIDPQYDRAMVPLRIIVEALDAQVSWIGATQTVVIFRHGTEIRLTIGESLPGGLGVPVLVSDRTFVPLRFISETFGANVRWDAAAQAVYVYRGA
ncbi:MAG: copper amine oxidase N-terminal domain-containing protein [Defluviitaleaceae bacterium]|nr:copper amine oxidase N-terminal domain-containing protein [Defluviitaleaceae bacterium]